MIEILSGFPEDVLAIKGRGEITAGDYRNVVAPAALAGIAKHKYLKLYYEIAPGAQFSAGAMWQDARLGVGHWGDWGKLAVVSDLAWIRDAMKAFAPFFHHPLRAFTPAQAQEAKAWIAQKD